MPIKYPIEYELKPMHMTEGRRWLTLRIKNTSTDDLSSLDVRLNSLDAYSISVHGSGNYMANLGPQEERMLAFQVLANTSSGLYVTIDGWRDNAPFHWESPNILITVGKEVAELASLFAMTEPYPAQNSKITCEAVVRGLEQSEGLQLEFWADTPGETLEELAAIETKALAPGETARYGAEITVEKRGAYTIYAYLYDDFKRIGRRTEHIYVT